MEQHQLPYPRRSYKNQKRALGRKLNLRQKYDLHIASSNRFLAQNVLT